MVTLAFLIGDIIIVLADVAADQLFFLSLRPLSIFSWCSYCCCLVLLIFVAIYVIIVVDLAVSSRRKNSECGVRKGATQAGFASAGGLMLREDGKEE